MDDEEKEELYKMDLNDETHFLPWDKDGKQVDDSLVTVIKVPGGWLYTLWGDGDGIKTTTFVPYNDEYKDNNKKIKKESN